MARARYSGVKTPHTVEWIVGVASTLLVIVVIGFVAFEATEPNLSPRLSIVRLTEDAAMPPNEVRFEVVNSAGTTASAVVVQGRFEDHAGADQTAEVTFDYVPAHSRARGTLIFSEPVEGGNVIIRASGYVDP